MDSSLFGGGGGGSSIPGFQRRPLEDLYKRAGAASRQTGGQLFGQQFEQPAFGAFEQQAGGGFQTPGLKSGLMDFGNEQNEYLDASVNSGLDSMAQNFQRNIMPQINLGSAMNNTSGGSRAGIAQANAANDFNKESSNFINQMYSGNWAQGMNNRLGASGQLTGLQGQQNAAQQGAMSQAPQLSNLGFSNQFGNLSNLAKLLGNPIQLQGETAAPGMLAPLQFGYQGGG